MNEYLLFSEIKSQYPAMHWTESQCEMLHRMNLVDGYSSPEGFRYHVPRLLDLHHAGYGNEDRSDRCCECSAYQSFFRQLEENTRIELFGISFSHKIERLPRSVALELDRRIRIVPADYAISLSYLRLRIVITELHNAKTYDRFGMIAWATVPEFAEILKQY